MSIRVVYPEVKGDRLDHASIIMAQFDDLEAAGKYLNDEVQPKVAPVQSRQLNEYKALLSAHENYVSFLLKKTVGDNSELPGPINLAPIPLPYQIDFCEHEDGGGDNFTLGVIQKVDPLVAVFPILSSCDWESDLTQRGGPCAGGTFNDCITSLNCRIFDKYWALCEHSHFRGQTLIGYGDINSLNNPAFYFPDGTCANDRVSSVVMNSTPAAIINAALQALISGGA